VETLFSVTHTGTEWVAVGRLQEVIASTNGLDWFTRRSQAPGDFLDVIHANGTLAVLYDRGWVRFSVNGSVWEEHFVSGTDVPFSIAYGAERWVIVGSDGNIWTSENKVKWTNRVSTTALNLNQVIYTEGEFITVGTGGTIVTSADGISWTRRNSGGSAHLNSVAHGNGLFVAVGDRGNVLTSSNRVQWTSRSLGAGFVFTDVAYGAGHFVAVGFDGVIAASMDGRNWGFLESPTNSWLFSVAYGDHGFLAVGEGGTIVQSDPFLELKLVREPFPTLRLSGPRERSVRIEALNELNYTSIWQPAATLFLGAEPLYWTDPANTQGPSRFYRAVLLP
jgi:hypothetical protein